MPVEIRELQINVTVNQQDTQQEVSSVGDPAFGGNTDYKKDFINQCIEQVLEILNNKKER